MYFADIHCHILSGVDDGAQTDVEMYEMLDSAYNAGVRYLCATPHCHPEMFPFDVLAEKEAFKKLSNYAKGKYPDMKLFHANEIFVYADVPSVVLERGMGIFPDEETVLIEFHINRTAPQIESTVKHLVQLGYTPVLAHVERYAALTPKLIANLKELGAVISVNAESVVGKTGRHPQKRVAKLISKGLVDIIVSDSHVKESFSSLKEAYELLARKYDKEWLEELFYFNSKAHVLPVYNEKI